jgi:serine/threonine protein kinase
MRHWQAARDPVYELVAEPSPLVSAVAAYELLEESGPIYELFSSGMARSSLKKDGTYEVADSSLPTKLLMERFLPGIEHVLAQRMYANPAAVAKQLRVSRADVTSLSSEVLEAGQVADLLCGLWKQPVVSGTSLKVAVRRLKLDPKLKVNARLEDDLMREVSAMAMLVHPNIATVLGIVPSAPPLLLTEFFNGGSLYVFVRTRVCAVPLPDALRMAKQIAAGMTFLGNKGVVHRDLAARNVMIHVTGCDFVCKLADIGLASVVEKVFPASKPLALPLRWMPPEAVLQRDFSSASDVWSFGVCVWEILTQGAFPFADIVTDAEVMPHVQAGGRPTRQMSDTMAVPDDLWTVLESCWLLKAADRPTFASLVSLLTTLRQDHHPHTSNANEAEFAQVQHLEQDASDFYEYLTLGEVCQRVPPAFSAQRPALSHSVSGGDSLGGKKVRYASVAVTDGTVVYAAVGPTPQSNIMKGSRGNKPAYAAVAKNNSDVYHVPMAAEGGLYGSFGDTSTDSVTPKRNLGTPLGRASAKKKKFNSFDSSSESSSSGDESGKDENRNTKSPPGQADGLDEVDRSSDGDEDGVNSHNLRSLRQLSQHQQTTSIDARGRKPSLLLTSTFSGSDSGGGLSTQKPLPPGYRSHEFANMWAKRTVSREEAEKFLWAAASANHT